MDIDQAFGRKHVGASASVVDAAFTLSEAAGHRHFLCATPFVFIIGL